MYSRGNYIKYLLINYNEKEYTYVCVTESLCSTPEANMTL